MRDTYENITRGIQIAFSVFTPGKEGIEQHELLFMIANKSDQFAGNSEGPV